MYSKLSHQPVMLSEVLDYWYRCPDGNYLDCTFGSGGHSLALLAKLAATARLVAIDLDIDAFNLMRKTAQVDNRLTALHGNFAGFNLPLKFFPNLLFDGILMDLGVSSLQVDDPARGFSYMKDGPLDMRMNICQRYSAFDFVNHLGLRAMADCFRRYGESPYSWQVANAIVRARQLKPIKTTLELVKIIQQALPKKLIYNHQKPFAMVFFQAIRIYLNDELRALEACLMNLKQVLKPTGRLVVLSFHSLEAQLVQRYFKKYSNVPKLLGVSAMDLRADFVILTPRPTYPSLCEQATNSRARSCRLHVIERVS